MSRFLKGGLGDLGLKAFFGSSWALECRPCFSCYEGSGFRVQGFRVQGLGFRV